MLIADTPTGLAEQVPFWVATLLMCLAAVGSTALTLVIGLWQLGKTEAYRRASRWEPMAEELWRERARAYREYLATYDDVVMEMTKATLLPDDQKMEQAKAAGVKLQRGSLILAEIASIRVHNAASCLTGVFKGQSRVTKDIRDFDVYIHDKLNELVNSMRDDLGVEAMDERIKEWFPQLPATAINSIEGPRN